MRGARRKMEKVARDERVQLAVNGEVTPATQHLDQPFAWCTVFGERLAGGESKQDDPGGGRGKERAANDAVFRENGFGGE